MTRTLLALALLASSLTPALAGLNDPIPSPFTKQLFNVPGVINNGVATVISCSSGLSSSTNVGVEWFRKNGTSVGVSSFTIPAGGTANFGSAGVATLAPLDATMPGGETLRSGAARVLSTTSSGIFCNAFLMDPSVDPPARMMQLLITGVKKQKGQ